MTFLIDPYRFAAAGGSGGTWTHVGSASDGTTSSVPSFSITIPAGAQAGDLGVVIYTVNDGSPATATIDVTPTGWSAIGSDPYNGATNAFMSSVAYWKAMDGTDIGTGAVVGNFSGFRTYRAAMTVWRPSGVISLDTFSIANGTGDGDPVPVTVSSIDVGTSGNLVLLLGTFSQATATYNFEAGYTQRATGVSGTRNVAIYSKIETSPGATGALDVSIQNNFFGHISWAASFNTT